MKAVVMAGGQGARLRPLTVARPKPLLPLVNKPVIAHILDWLKRYDIFDTVVTLQHQAEWFQSHLGRGRSIGMNIQYVIEEEPLGTAGGVRYALKTGKLQPDDTVVVVSGDASTDIDLQSLLDFHKERKAEVTVALHRVANPSEYGMVITENDGRITQFVEKPGWAEVVSDQVNTGIYVLEASVLEQAPEDIMYDFSHDLFPKLLAQGRALYGFVPAGYWCDVGTPPAYLQACIDVLQRQVCVEPLGKSVGGDIWMGEQVEIASDAQLYGPIYLGHNVQIKRGVVVQGPAVIRDDTVVDRHALISRSVIWRGCYVGENTRLLGALVSKQCVFKSKAQVQEGAVIGDKCIIGEDAIIYADVKLWPGKAIETGTEVRDSIIWGSHARRVLFGRFGVTGVVNVDLTPEFAAKLGVAFGASLPKASLVTINRDSHPSSRMLKRAIISGLPAAGVDVLDLRSQPVPIARYYTRTSEAVAGVHVRISPHDRRVVDIRFNNAEGLNLGRSAERIVEQLFFREDFRRAQLDDIGKIDYALAPEKRYTKVFLDSLDREGIEAASFTIALDYAHASTIDVLEPILSQLRVDVVGLNTRSEPSMLSIQQKGWESGMTLLAKMVQAMGLDLGARVDVSGEKLFLVDGTGKRVSNVMAAAAMAEMVWRNHPGATVALPVDRPNVFERLAADSGGSVIRTKVDIQALMTEANQSNVKLALDGSGHFIFPDLQPFPDGMFAIARLLQYLAQSKVSLAEIIADIPTFEWRHETILCPWEVKGRVMRQVNTRVENYNSDQIDGVRWCIDGERWLLIRSDPDKAFLHVYAESPSPEETETLLHEQMTWLQSLIAS